MNDFSVNETKQSKWEPTRKRGMWFYLLQNAALTAVVFLVMDALIGSGYTLLKQGNWDKYVQQVDWIKLLRQGFIVGLVVGWYNWRKQEKAFGRKQL